MNLWPEHYGVSPDHCADVLNGSYDVPVHAQVVLDVGANVGAFAKWARGKWPDAVIHSFEPQPDNYTLLRETVAGLPNPDKIFCHPIAILDVSGIIPLVAGKFNCGEWSLFGAGDADRTKFVPVQVMDAVILPKADVLKIDTEGGEPNILKRLIELGRIKEFSAIMLEYHRAGEEKSLPDLLAPHGFTLFSHKQGVSESRGELKFLKA